MDPMDPMHGSRARAPNDDDDVAKHGGHSPANTKCWFTTSLIFDIHVIVNWHLPEQGIRWPVSRDHIVGSGLELIEAMCFVKLSTDQVFIFDWIAGSYQVNLL